MAATITESQWVLALSAFLLIVASVQNSRKARTFDFFILLLCALTGPFCILLLPISLLFLTINRQDRWRRGAPLLLGAGALIQAGSLLLHASGRGHAALGANPEWLIRILGGQIVMGTLLGSNPLAVTTSLAFLACVIAVSVAMISVSARHFPLALQTLLVFSAMTFALSLASPIAFPPSGMTVWQLLAHSSGTHYWFFVSA